MTLAAFWSVTRAVHLCWIHLTCFSLWYHTGIEVCSVSECLCCCFWECQSYIYICQAVNVCVCVGSFWICQWHSMWYCYVSVRTICIFLSLVLCVQHEIHSVSDSGINVQMSGFSTGWNCGFKFSHWCLCMCLYMFVWVFVNVGRCVCVCICAFVSVCEYTCVCVPVCVSVPVYLWLY